MLTFFAIIIVILSAVIHEVSHGFVAYKLGDPTAKLAGRLTLNPLKHLDPFGSIILPIFLSLIPGGIIFGWAKPVPYNPFNLKNPEKGAAQIALAGPLSNFILAFLFGVVVRLTFNSPSPFLNNVNFLATLIVMINITLGVFNLVPIPPLDGAKVLQYLIPDRFYKIKIFLNENNLYGWFLLMIFILVGFSFITPLINFIFKLLTGVNFY
jgi:Zn-dependent protease